MATTGRRTGGRKPVAAGGAVIARKPVDGPTPVPAALAATPSAKPSAVPVAKAPAPKTATRAPARVEPVAKAPAPRPVAEKPAPEKPALAKPVAAKPVAAKPAPAPAPIQAAKPVTVPVTPAPAEKIEEAVVEAAKAVVAPIVETATVPVAPTPAVPATIAAKEPIMATVIDNAQNAAHDTSAKAQAMFTDMTERSKGTVEKSQKMLSELADFGKGNVEAMVESSKIAARGIETMGQDVAAYAKSSFESASEALKTMSSVKSPTEFMKLQADYARAAFDAMIAHTSKSTEASLKLAGEVAQPISNRIAVAAEKIKVAA